MNYSYHRTIYYVELLLLNFDLGLSCEFKWGYLMKPILFNFIGAY